MATNKYYTSEEIEFYNGDTTTARPLPIKPLKALQSVFEDYAEDVRRMAMLMREVTDKTKEMQDAGEDPEEYYETARQKAKDANYMSWNDCLAQGALIALHVWKVNDTKRKQVNVDMDYVEENLDIPTAQRICEIAGNFKLGELSQDDEPAVDAEGKASEDLTT